MCPAAAVVVRDDDLPTFGVYLPTAAAAGGGYSAIVASSVVGSGGGRVLVDRTVGLINSLWPNE